MVAAFELLGKAEAQARELARAMLKSGRAASVARPRASRSGSNSQLSRQPRLAPSFASSMSPSAGLRQMKRARGSQCCWIRRWLHDSLERCGDRAAFGPPFAFAEL